MNFGHRTLAAALVVLIACGDGDEPRVCDEMEEMFCTAACTPVLVRCTYEDLEATEVACPDGCGARALVLIDACNTGVEASLAEIEADMVCEILDSTPY